MGKFPYTVKVSSIPKFFAHIQSAGVPKDKVTGTYLKSVGFTSGNDNYLTGILKSLKFLDASGLPTSRWRAYRDADKAPAVLADAIREAYTELFDVYPDAYQKDNEALTNFMRTHSDLGDETLQRAVNTFKALVALADFSKSPVHIEVADDEGATPDGDEDTGAPTRDIAIPKSGPVININVELTIPATDDKTVYENFFKAMREHLLDVKE